MIKLRETASDRLLELDSSSDQIEQLTKQVQVAALGNDQGRART